MFKSFFFILKICSSTDLIEFFNQLPSEWVCQSLGKVELALLVLLEELSGPVPEELVEADLTRITTLLYKIFPKIVAQKLLLGLRKRAPSTS